VACEIRGSHSCDDIGCSDAVALDSSKDYNAAIFRVRPGSFWLLDCKVEGTVILQDVRNFSPNNTAPHPR